MCFRWGEGQGEESQVCCGVNHFLITGPFPLVWWVPLQVLLHRGRRRQLAAGRVAQHMGSSQNQLCSERRSQSEPRVCVLTSDPRCHRRDMTPVITAAG